MLRARRTAVARRHAQCSFSISSPRPWTAAATFRICIGVSHPGDSSEDFLTVDTVLLRRIHVLVFISLCRRRIRVRRLHEPPRRHLSGAAGPPRAPNANAHIERWIGSLRRECLDRLLIFSPRQLEHIPPHLHSPLQRAATTPRTRPTNARTDRPSHHARRLSRQNKAHRRELLGGLIHEYELATA